MCLNLTPRAVAILWASMAMNPALAGASTVLQGSQSCPRPEFPLSAAALDSATRIPSENGTLNRQLYELTRAQAQPQPVSAVLLVAVDQHSPGVVASALLTIAHYGTANGIDAIDAVDRGRAIIAYGLLHSTFPDMVTAAMFPALLTRPYYEDDLRTGVVQATEYIAESNDDINLALSLVLCQALDHMRPFVASEADLSMPGPPQRLAWHQSGVRLLRRVVNALAIRPGGKELVGSYISMESNVVLRDRLIEWTREARKEPFWAR